MSETRDLRLPALRRFAVAITALNVLGHTVLGFEQSWAQPIVAVLTAYATEMLLELIEARRAGRRPRFLGPGTAPVDFLLSPHISGLAVAMLLYANSRLLPIAFAAAVAIASKYVFRVGGIVGSGGSGGSGRSRHVFNPSNLGITATLLAFPWVGIAQPYMFTENLSNALAWALPAFIVLSGSFLNTRFTRRVPLILAWLAAFVLQAVARHFLLFTFYMVTDPATTPATVRGQIAFGAAVAAAYGTLMAFHVVFGLFFGLSAVCTLRGLLLAAEAWRARPAAERAPAVHPPVHQERPELPLDLQAPALAERTGT